MFYFGQMLQEFFLYFKFFYFLKNNVQVFNHLFYISNDLCFIIKAKNASIIFALFLYFFVLLSQIVCTLEHNTIVLQFWTFCFYYSTVNNCVCIPNSFTWFTGAHTNISFKKNLKYFENETFNTHPIFQKL
ncbi:hypothetical protein RFI_31556 [Reticulomyxa filosa]|uniref:Uncharacterized protein n=1 Tax=Reticulomyxa filosa TaxID=46433 RepID=X6LYP1_RETFI|nr:hypothetical protein RFI_31556 [Reticulomyxa filosa]|eukprot:ETO05840.1 hypothetical protein RFI_31556 [Reticulomyxa filosa]